MSIEKKIFNYTICVSILLTLIGVISIIYGFALSSNDVLNAGIAIIIFCMILIGCLCAAKEYRRKVKEQENIRRIMFEIQQQPIVVVVHQLPAGLHRHLQPLSRSPKQLQFLHITKTSYHGRTCVIA